MDGGEGRMFFLPSSGKFTQQWEIVAVPDKHNFFIPERASIGGAAH